MSDKRKPKVVVVDDHPIVLEGLVKLLNKNNSFTLAGSFATGKSLLDFLELHIVDLLLLDIALPDMNGIDLCTQVKILYPYIIVLAFSNHTERSVILKMMRSGANGYLMKSTPPHEIINCLKAALGGEIVFGTDVEEVIAKSKNDSVLERPSKLSLREKEILKLIVSGETTQQIAQTLYLSKFTVENHRKNVMQKLHVKNVAELVKITIEQNLL